MEGVEPCAVQVARTVLNGEDEETGRKALRLVPTQRPRSGCWRGSPRALGSIAFRLQE